MLLKPLGQPVIVVLHVLDIVILTLIMHDRIFN
jgi:hypothetical protein